MAETFTDDTPVGKRELYHDPELDFYVLAHVQEGGKTGKPHSHGTSWAIYGNAWNVTEMTEWRRVNPESEEHVVLEASSKYELRPGQTRAYGPDVIHSTAPSREGLGDPRHRHRSRQAAALSLPQAGQDSGEGVRRAYAIAPSPGAGLVATPWTGGSATSSAR